MVNNIPPIYMGLSLIEIPGTRNTTFPPNTPTTQQSPDKTLNTAIDNLTTKNLTTSNTATTSHMDKSYYGEKLSLHFHKIEVRPLLQIFADFTNLNIVTSDRVSGELSLRLTDVPWDQALDIVLHAKGLAMRKNGSVLWISTREELLLNEKQELEQKMQIAELEPLHSEVFQLNYQKADTFRSAFGLNEKTTVRDTTSNTKDTPKNQSILSRRGSALVDSRTNQLFITDTSAVLEKIRGLLEKVDIPARQVLIEARIVEADHMFSHHLGIRLGLSATYNNLALGNIPTSSHTQAVADSNTSNSSGKQTMPQIGNGVDPHVATSFGLSLFNAAASSLLAMELSALEANGKGNIIASPRVITADQQAALIEQGEEIPYQQSTRRGATSVTFRKAYLKLEVTPHITPDGHVILSVDINKDSRGTITTNGLAINTKHVKTRVQVEDGGTVIIGGIYTQAESTLTSQVPLLGDIPIFGMLFKNNSRTHNKTELLIFLTPQIVNSKLSTQLSTPLPNTLSPH